MEDSNLDLWMQAENVTPPTPRSGNETEDDPKTVLVTGCSGFLGRHLLLSLLQHPRCRKVYCHIRGKSEGEQSFACSLHIHVAYIR